jgi:hypothetical protein
VSAQRFLVTPRCRSVIGPFGGLFGEIIESVVGLQKRLDPLPQLGIAVAFAVEDSTAARGVMMACGLKENSLHALRVQRHGMLLQWGTRSPIHTLTRHSCPTLSKKNEKTRIDKMCWAARADEDQMKASIAAPSTIEFVGQEVVIESEIGRIVQPPRASPSQARA